MKRMKKKLRNVNDIRRDKSSSCTNLSSSSYPPRKLFSAVSTSNIAEDDNDNDTEHSSSSTIKPLGQGDISSVDSSCGPIDASSIASGSIASSVKDHGSSMTTYIEVSEKGAQSASPETTNSQDYNKSAGIEVGTRVLVRKWSKRTSNSDIRIFPIEENENTGASSIKNDEEPNDKCIDVTEIEYIDGTHDDTHLVEKDTVDFCHGFQKISTIPVAVLLIMHSLVMITLIFLLPILCEKRTKPPQQNKPQNSTDDPNSFHQCYVDSFSLLIYCHSIYWLAHLIWDQYLKKKHKENRISGYLDFYLDTKNIRRAPFYIVSSCNFLLLLLTTLLHDYDNYINQYYDNFRKVDWIRGVITIECITIICLQIFYIRKTTCFNRKDKLPDVMCNSYMERLRTSLAWDWGHCNTKDANGEQTPDEVREWDRKVKESLMKYQQAIYRKINPPNQYISILQAELINFLIQQIKQKNKKLVYLIQQVSELGNIVECDVEVGNQVITC